MLCWEFLMWSPVFKPNLCYRAAEFWDEVTWIEFLPLLAASDLFSLCLLCLLEAPALYQLSPLSFFPPQLNPPPSYLYWNILSPQFICQFFLFLFNSIRLCPVSVSSLFILSSYPSPNQQTQHFSILWRADEPKAKQRFCVRTEEQMRFHCFPSDKEKCCCGSSL